MPSNKAQSNSEPSTRIIVVGKHGDVKLSEEGLRKWFQSDGKSGWKQAGGAYDGKPCARQEGQKSTPKCVSSDKYSSMSKKERSSAHSRKNSADPNQPQKSGAAKPTYVSTDKPKKVKESYIDERSLSKSEKKEKERLVKGMKKSYKDFKARYGKDSESVMYATNLAKNETVDEGLAKEVPNCVKEEEELINEKAGEKDACYKKVKASAKVWPSAYASGRLVQCRKKGAANYGNKSEEITYQEFQEKCWKGYKRVGMKKKGNKMVPNCVPEEVQNEGAAWTRKEGQNPEGGLNDKGRASLRAQGQDIKPPQPEGGKRKDSYCARSKGQMKMWPKAAKDPDSRLRKARRKWKCRN